MEVVVPDLGDFDDVEVVEVLVKPGDSVAKETPLITLETDKAAMEVPSPAAGEVGELKVSVGDRVSAGDVIMLLNRAEPDTQEPAADAERAAGDERPEEDKTVRQPRPRRPDGQVSEAQAEPEPVAVPDLGDFDKVDVIDVLVAAGDHVEAEQGLISLETEKATMDVPAPKAGTVVDLKVQVGDQVSAGDEILTLRADAPRRSREEGEVPAQPETVERGPPEGPSAPSQAPSQPSAGARGRAPVDEAGFSRAHASPSVRKLARELGVDLVRVNGSGRKGRITADDLKAYVKGIMHAAPAGAAALPAVPDVDFAKFGEIDIAPLGRIARIAGPRLHASWVNIPHVTQHDEADITELEEARQSLKDQAKERGIRLTPLAFVIRACVLMLAEFPRFKASLTSDGQSLVMKHYTHVGFAADTPNGLLVPVIRDADRMDVYELAKQLGELSERARAGKLKPDEMQGGVFSVSSLGGIGGTFFTPIINAPEVAILGVSRSYVKPVYRNEQFVPRLTLPLSLSYDHRVIDGAEAVRFTTRLAELLGDVEQLLEAIP